MSNTRRDRSSSNLFNELKSELVFGYPLVSAARIEHKLFLHLNSHELIGVELMPNMVSIC